MATSLRLDVGPTSGSRSERKPDNKRPDGGCVGREGRLERVQHLGELRRLISHSAARHAEATPPPSSPLLSFSYSGELRDEGDEVFPSPKTLGSGGPGGDQVKGAGGGVCAREPSEQRLAILRLVPLSALRSCSALFQLPSLRSPPDVSRCTPNASPDGQTHLPTSLLFPVSFPAPLTHLSLTGLVSSPDVS
ncbi:unnamed protein product [Pleuronectes platessa]|uniref:Uncharacterized protein n=1 Tax=Pleuronectes platessa TaxID=8262 RepID=A0A9N7VNZ7_PLEPL|nr:unnamed protein product [Pleuronectes platessa]